MADDSAEQEDIGVKIIPANQAAAGFKKLPTKLTQFILKRSVNKVDLIGEAQMIRPSTNR